MSTTTSNLELIKPDLENEIHQTILDLASNFQKLDDKAEQYLNVAPTSGDWLKGKHIWNQNPISGGYAGWINLRSGKATTLWATLTFRTAGDLISPTVNNGHFYICVQSGYSGVSEPIFPVTTEGIVEDTRNSTTWQPSTFYEINQIVKPALDNDRFYLCTSPGQTGATEPTWSNTDGSITNDSSVVWTSYRIAKWQEQGISSNFRPYGKIE